MLQKHTVFNNIQRNGDDGSTTFMSGAIVSGMVLKLRLRQSAVLSPNIVATEQRVGGASSAAAVDRLNVRKHVVQIYDIHPTTHAVGPYQYIRLFTNSNFKPRLHLTTAVLRPLK